jgi:pimeloyl-ACP methyl ester carboxylesterase
LSKALATATEFDLELPSGRLHAQRFGPHDAPLALCVPGVSANMKEFDFLAERIAGDALQVVALDLRGRGQSEVTSLGSYGWPSHARDVFAAADALEAGTFSVVGHSMGGYVAMAAAEQNAERLDRVVLIDVAGAADPTSLIAIESSVSRLGTVYPSAEFYIEAVKKLGLVEPWSLYWDRYFQYELEPVEGGVRSRSNKAAVLEDYAYGGSHDPYVLWKALTMPVLLVYATREILPGLGRIVRAGDRERFERDVPSSTVADVDANHYTVVTVDQTVTAIQRFFGLS